MMKRLSLGLGRALEVVIGVLVAMAVLAVFAQVLFRYVFDIPLQWTEEFARYLMVWIVLIGAALGFRSGTHFRFVIILQLLPKALQGPLGLILESLTCVFLAVFLGATIPLLWIAADQTAPGLGISMFWLYLALPFGAALMLLFLTIEIFFGPHEPLPHELAEREQENIPQQVE